MFFDLFPCLTAESYVLHAIWMERISYRKKNFPNGDVNEKGYQLIQINRIMKTGINPDRTGLEQAVSFSSLQHTFNDSKYRRVFYQLEAVSKFKKYFPAGISDFSVFGSDPVATQPTGNETDLAPDDLRDVVKTWTSVLSSNQPPALTVDRIVPLMRWEGAVQSGGLERKCDTVRVYLEGDWYATGGLEDESVAVFFIDRTIAAQRLVNSKNVPIELNGVISQMGLDPAANYNNTTRRDLPVITDGFFFQSSSTILPLVTFIRVQESILIKIKNLDFENRGDNLYGEYFVAAAIFKVHFMPPGKDEELGKFYIDIRINNEELLREFYFPFIRFGIARYQANTINTLDSAGNGIDSRFSKVAVTDFVQLLPYRKLTADGKGLVYTAPATRTQPPNTTPPPEPPPPPLKNNTLVYLKGNNRLDTVKQITNINLPDAPHEIEITDTGDTVVDTAGALTDKFIVEEYEHYSNLEHMAPDTQPREDFTKRLIFTYSHGIHK